MSKRQRIAQVSGRAFQKQDELVERKFPGDLTDMLRYDSCTVVEGTWSVTGTIHKGGHVRYQWTCKVVTDYYNFTPARWASFGIRFVEVD